MKFSAILLMWQTHRLSEVEYHWFEFWMMTVRTDVYFGFYMSLGGGGGGIATIGTGQCAVRFTYRIRVCSGN